MGAGAVAATCQILGKITANGQVYLVNPNGVYFGKSASVYCSDFQSTQAKPM